jgi:SPP1 family phage portal protein
VFWLNTGRKEIYTSEREITIDNVIQVLRDAYLIHSQNADRIRFLDQYEKGNQPLVRTKAYRSDIDVLDIDNVANEVTNFNTSYKWGNPFTITQRGEREDFDEEILKGISELNLHYELNEMRSKTQQLGRNVEIGALGYTYIEPNYENDGTEPCFKVVVLNPEYTFIVKSSYYIDKRDMMAVTYRNDGAGNTYFTCYTKDHIFIIVNLVKFVNGTEDSEWYHDEENSGIKNPMGMIPIVEWFRDYDRMGVFERHIQDMDALNILASDICNATEEAVQAMWHCNDVDFPKDENGNVIKPKNNDWLQTFTTRDGKTPFITPMSCDFDYAGNLNYYLSKRALILEKCNVPQRSDNSGGSTTGAMDSANGYATAELSASKQQCIQESCKMKELRLVLRAISLASNINADNPMHSLKISDLQPNIKRTKNFEMVTKTNALATMLSHGIHGLHALKTVNLFGDPLEVYKDSQDLIDKYQNKAFGESNTSDEKVASDESDQIANSPLIDGMSLENPNGEKTE